jgi:hypothetical protein
MSGFSLPGNATPIVSGGWSAEAGENRSQGLVRAAHAPRGNLAWRCPGTTDNFVARRETGRFVASPLAGA